MKTKQFWIAVVVTFVVVFGLESLIHGCLLDSDYQAIAQLYRPKPEMTEKMGWMALAYVILSIGLVWIYDRGKDAKPFLGQGLRFGAAVAAISSVPTAMIYYVVQPLSCALVTKQTLLGIAEALILGVVVAFLRR